MLRELVWNNGYQLFVEKGKYFCTRVLTGAGRRYTFEPYHGGHAVSLVNKGDNPMDTVTVWNLAVMAFVVGLPGAVVLHDIIVVGRLRHVARNYGKGLDRTRTGC